MTEDFRLRPLQLDDGPAMEVLERQTPDTGAMGFYIEYHRKLKEKNPLAQKGERV